MWNLIGIRFFASTSIAASLRCVERTANRSSDPLTHPVGAGLFVPFRGHLFRLRPELDRAAAGDIAHAELRLVPAAEAERLARDRHPDVHPDHARALVLHHVPRD